MSYRKVLSATLVFALFVAIVPAQAQNEAEISITVTPTVVCDGVAFEISLSGGTGPYVMSLDFGDGEGLAEESLSSLSYVVSHTYPAQGEYEWSLSLSDSDGENEEVEGTIIIDGPTMTLSSVPFPPLLSLDSGEATVEFTAEVTGGTAPYSYEWDLNGDGIADADADSASNSFTYSQEGKFKARAMVTDACGFTHTDTLTVIVGETDEIEDETACHPTAQKIADAVSNTLYPLGQALQFYFCDDIFGIFNGDLTGSQVGFGRLWRAYNLSLTIKELTWEEIRDWQLDGTGWGLLTRLDRYAEVLTDVSIVDLMGLVLSGDNSINDIRTAVRAAVNYEANFEDALSRLADGASSGEIGQFYRMAQELEVDPDVLDGYLESGVSLSELRHATKVAEQTGSDWEIVAEARASDHGWGEIKQAFKLSTEEVGFTTIMDIGVQEYRRQQRDDSREEREIEREIKMTESKATQIANKNGVSEAEVVAIYEGTCESDWGCVRAHFRELSRSEDSGGPPEGRGKDKDNQGKGKDKE